MRRQVTLTPDTVFENQRTSKVYRMYTEQQRRLLRQSTFTNLIGIIPFEMNDWRYAAIHIRVLSPSVYQNLETLVSVKVLLKCR